MDTSESSGELTSELFDEEVLAEAGLYDEAPLDGAPPQLYDPDDPLGPDTEPTMVAESGFGGAAVSAEEAAIRVEEEPEGMNYDEDPGYLE